MHLLLVLLTQQRINAKLLQHVILILCKNNVLKTPLVNHVFGLELNAEIKYVPMLQVPLVIKLTQTVKTSQPLVIHVQLFQELIKLDV